LVLENNLKKIQDTCIFLKEVDESFGSYFGPGSIGWETVIQTLNGKLWTRVVPFSITRVLAEYALLRNSKISGISGLERGFIHHRNNANQFHLLQKDVLNVFSVIRLRVARKKNFPSKCSWNRQYFLFHLKVWLKKILKTSLTWPNLTSKAPVCSFTPSNSEVSLNLFFHPLPPSIGSIGWNSISIFDKVINHLLFDHLTRILSK
jgi:hypothetical protein